MEYLKRSFWASLTCGILCVTVSGSEPADNLKLYVGFENTPNATIKTSGTGLKKSENIEYAKGKIGKAIKVAARPGKLADLIYKSGNVFAKSEWTITMWVKLNRSGGSRSKRSRTLFRTYSSGGWQDGTYVAQFNKWGGFDFMNYDLNKKACSSKTSGKIVPKEKWTHLAFTFNNGIKKIYVNGYKANLTQNDKVENPGSIQRHIRLGSTYPKSNDYIDGLIDEFKLFDKALSSEDILKNMNIVPKPAPEKKKAVLYIPLDGKFDGHTADGTASASGEKVIFKKTKHGQGALMIRHNYDARASLSYSQLNGLFGQRTTIGFFFTPTKVDFEDRGLLIAQCGDKSWRFTRKNKDISFAIYSGSNKTSVSINNVIQQNKSLHIIGGYDLKAKKVFLEVNGIRKTAPTNLSIISNGLSTLTVGDIPGFERYKNSQAEGIIDEISIFPAVLSSKHFTAMSTLLRKKYLAQKNIASKSISSSAPNSREREEWNMAKAYKAVTPYRQKICLNALWRFKLGDSDRFPTKTKWHYMAVPGRYSGYGNGNSDHKFLIRDPQFKIISNSSRWQGLPVYKYRNAWYERTFKVDPAWKGKKIVLIFEELSASQKGQVYLNGKKISLLANGKNYQIELDPKQLKWQNENFLLIHLESTGARWAWRGIKGNVWLNILPKIHLKRPAIVTSFRDKNIKLSAQVVNDGKLSDKLYIETIISGKNAPKNISSKPTVSNSGKIAKISISKAWKNAELWSYVTPYLYQVVIRLKNKNGKVIDELPAIKFGFREFWIKGSDYYLNGLKVHLLNHDSWSVSSSDYNWCKKYVRELKSLGYNSLRGAFNDKDLYMENILRACDEEGLLFFANIYGVSRGEFVAWNNPATKQALEKKMRAEIDFMRNHPSVIMWYLSVNFLGYGWDYHPLKMTDGYLPSFNMSKYKACLDAVDILHKYDKSRPYFFQAGGAFGPVINSNAYFCWWPEAEMIAWPQEWSKKRPKPLHIIETSFPYWNTWAGMDISYPGAKPFFLPENAARYFGQKAYVDLDRKWLPMLRDPYGKSGASIKWDLVKNVRDIRLLQKVKSRMLINTIWNWRGAGISGICPFAQVKYAYKRKSQSSSIHTAFSEKRQIKNFRTPGWHQDIWKVAAHKDIDVKNPIKLIKGALEKSLAPVLVYIGGDTVNPTSQANSWFSGNNINKTAVLINGTLKKYSFNLKWQFACGSSIKSGKINVSLPPGGIKHIPVTIKAPAVNKKTSFTLTIDSSSKLAIKPFSGTVYPKLKTMKLHGKIALLDLKGETTKDLNNIGVKFIDLKSVNDISGIKLVIIGRESLTRELAPLSMKLQLSKAINDGKLNMVIMEQQPDALKMLGFNTNNIYARKVFKSVNASPLLQGLDNQALSWWQGNGSLAPSKQAPPADTQSRVANPLWHWSNLNMVCSYPITRPTAAGFTSLLSTGKDLMYTPLLEATSGKGKILFCQMELTGRINTSPGAAMLLRNILKNYSATNSQHNKITITAANNKALELLKKLNVHYQKTPGSMVLFAGNNIPKLQKLTEYCKKGIDVIVQTNSQTAAKLGINAKSIKINEYQVTSSGKKLLHNLMPRDRFIRYAQPVTVFSGKGFNALVNPAFAVVKSYGKGRLFLIGMNSSNINKNMIRDFNAAKNGSGYFADYLVKERIVLFWQSLLAGLKAKPVSFAGNFNSLRQDITQNIAGKWAFKFDPENSGMKQGWNKANYDFSVWTIINAPGYWEHQKVKSKINSEKYNGFAWYRKNVVLDKALTGKKLILKIGAVDDFDWIYINGILVGKTGKETQGYWNAPRNYIIPANLTKAGKLHIAVRIQDIRGNGGIKGPMQVVFPRVQVAGNIYIDKIPEYDSETHIRW